MSPRVDFYLLATSIENGLVVACRLIEKAYAAGQTLFVLCKHAEQAAQLNVQLWTFRDISFVPHGLIEDQTFSPVLLGCKLPRVKPCDILLNLSESLPEGWQDFQRIMQFVGNEAAERAQGRELYKQYREKGCELHTHNLDK